MGQRSRCYKISNFYTFETERRFRKLNVPKQKRKEKNWKRKESKDEQKEEKRETETNKNEKKQTNK